MHCYRCQNVLRETAQGTSSLVEKSCALLLGQLGVLIYQVDYRKNGKIEAGLGTLGFSLVQSLRARSREAALPWFHEMFIATIQGGFDSLRQDYRISLMDQELMIYSYIRLREEAGMTPFEWPPAV